MEISFQRLIDNYFDETSHRVKAIFRDFVVRKVLLRFFETLLVFYHIVYRYKRFAAWRRLRSQNSKNLPFSRTYLLFSDFTKKQTAGRETINQLHAA